jgi:hypothetical protein
VALEGAAFMSPGYSARAGRHPKCARPRLLSVRQRRNWPRNLIIDAYEPEANSACRCFSDDDGHGLAGILNRVVLIGAKLMPVTVTGLHWLARQAACSRA